MAKSFEPARAQACLLVPRRQNVAEGVDHEYLGWRRRSTSASTAIAAHAMRSSSRARQKSRSIATLGQVAEILHPPRRELVDSIKAVHGLGSQIGEARPAQSAGGGEDGFAFRGQGYEGRDAFAVNCGENQRALAPRMIPEGGLARVRQVWVSR